MKIGKLNSGDFIMHRSGKDICWEVVQVLKQERRALRVILRPWNLGYAGRPWLVTEDQHVHFIGAHELDDWCQLDPEVMTTPRTTSGVPPEAE